MTLCSRTCARSSTISSITRSCRFPPSSRWRHGWRTSMGRLIGYGKLGRSMPLTLEACGNLGGDVEMVAVVKELALRHPDDRFILVGRNSGEEPESVGMPSNVMNPWTKWREDLRRRLQFANIKGNLT